jgi:hypothetical protein
MAEAMQNGGRKTGFEPSSYMTLGKQIWRGRYSLGRAESLRKKDRVRIGLNSSEPCSLKWKFKPLTATAPTSSG